MRGEVDIVVVNYRTPQDLKRFCTSLQEQTSLRYKLFIANVEAEVEDRAVAQGFQPFYQADFSENVGYARAVNHLVSGGESPIVGIFNADCEFQGPITPLLREFEEHANWGCVGPRQVDEAGRITAAGIFGSNVHPEHRGWKRPDTGQYSDVRTDAITLSGAALFTRRSTWNQMHSCKIFQQEFPDAEGAFLPTPHYYEETGYIYHMRKHGYDAVYYGPTKMIHSWHKASKTGGWADQQMPKSREIFRGFCKAHSIPCD